LFNYCVFAGFCEYNVGDSNAIGPFILTNQERTFSTAQFNSFLSRIIAGDYQVCLRVKGSDVSQSTGVLATFQKAVIGVTTSEGTKVTSSNIILGEQNILLISLSQTSFSKASIIMSGKSCTSTVDNPADSVINSSGHLDVRNGTILVKKEISSLERLPPLIYHLCLYSVKDQWTATGISLTSKPDCSSLTYASDIYANQSNTMQGAFNALILNINVADSNIDNSSILYVEGLKGSLTPDDSRMYIEGNSVVQKETVLLCQGQEPFPSCSVDLSDYMLNGHILLGITFSVLVKCTDFNGPNKIVSIDVGSSSATSSIHFQSGPWKDCTNLCQTESTAVSNYDIMALAAGNAPIKVNVSAPSFITYFNCSGPILQARVVFNIKYAKLGSSSLYGSWSRESGVLAVRDIYSIMDRPWLSFTVLLQNPTRQYSKQYPSAYLCTFGYGISGQGNTPRVSSSGILESSKSPSISNVSLSTSSSVAGALNRINIELNSNVNIPDFVDISISGLDGMRTIDTSRLSILNGSVDISQFSCRQSGPRKCLAVIDPKSQRESLYRALVNAELFCSDFAGIGKNISKIRFCSNLQNSTCPPSEYDCSYGFDSANGCSVSPIAYATGPWQECGICENTQRAVIRGYDITRLLKSGKSHIYMEIEVSMAVSPVSCYNSFDTSSSVPVRAAISLSTEFSSLFGTWRSKDGVLVFRPNSEMKKCSILQKTCQSKLTFSFELVNPLVSTTIVPTISGGGGGLKFRPAVLPAVELVRSSTYSFSAAAMRESKLGGNSIFNVDFKSSVPMPAGTLITLQGLRGSTSPSRICNVLGGAECSQSSSCIFLGSDSSCQRGLIITGQDIGYTKSASWDQSTGILIFAVDASFQGFTSIAFSFTIATPSQNPASIATTLSASRMEGNSILTWTEMALDGFRGSVTPEMLLIPEIRDIDFRESSNVFWQENTVTLSASSNVEISAGSIFMVSGLTTMTSAKAVWTQYPEVIPFLLNGTSQSGRWQGLVSTESAQYQYYPSWYCIAGSWIWDVDSDLYGGLTNVIHDESWCSLPSPYSVITTLSSSIRSVVFSSVIKLNVTIYKYDI
jgi:hypothetical protein